jgi:CelD/BcsL family acetyltransferase involved in cellulose biosynthesis
MGAAQVRLDDGGLEHLDRLIALKRDQYRRTGEYDVFACGWTRDLLEILLDEGEPAFGGRLSLLEADGRPVAYEYSLVAGGRRHFWFPTFEPEAGRHSPGVLLTLDVIREGAAAGQTWFDFGLSGEPYKKYFANSHLLVHEGEATAPGWRSRASAAFAVVERAGDRLTRGAVTDLRRRVQRRLDVVWACETSVWRRCAGAVGQARAVLARSAQMTGKS